MTTHLEQELEAVKSKMFEMADLAMESIYRSIDALKQSSTKLAEDVIKKDTALDDLEKALDEECIRILVTKQPAAVDLRLVLSILKINTDLERIGDLAGNIAKEALRLNGRPPIKPLVDIPRMADICVDMLKAALGAFAEKKPDAALAVIDRDREIDELNMQVYRELFTFMAENPHVMSEALGLIMVSKNLERIGDHATNIAEKAIYYIEGEDVRHTL